VRVPAGPRSLTDIDPLSPIAHLSYEHETWTSPIRVTTNETDRKLRETLEKWQALPRESLAAIRDELSVKDFYTLIGFAQRAAMFTVRDADPAWAVSAASGLAAIAGHQVDARDLILAAQLTACALRQAGAEGVRAVEHATSCSESETKAILERSLLDPPASLRECGFDLVATADGLALIRDGFEPYAPTVDLIAMALELAATVDADRYRVAGMELGAKLHDVWFRGPRHANAKDAIARIKGCASFHAFLHPNLDANRQSLMVFISQLQNAADAETLVVAARDAALGQAVLSAVDGLVCGVVIARSLVSGVEGLETTASLQRFKAPLTAALARQVRSMM
jgi:pterin-4a-carbinolamine dehydratase